MACRLAGFRLDACLRHLDLMGVFIYILNELLLFTGEECCWPTTVGFIKQPDYSLCFPAFKPGADRFVANLKQFTQAGHQIAPVAQEQAPGPLPDTVAGMVAVRFFQCLLFFRGQGAYGFHGVVIKANDGYDYPTRASLRITFA